MSVHSLCNHSFVFGRVGCGFKKIIDHVFGFQKGFLLFRMGQLGFVLTWRDNLPEILFQLIKIIQDFVCCSASSRIKMALD